MTAITTEESNLLERLANFYEYFSSEELARELIDEMYQEYKIPMSVSRLAIKKLAPWVLKKAEQAGKRLAGSSLKVAHQKLSEKFATYRFLSQDILEIIEAKISGKLEHKAALKARMQHVQEALLDPQKARAAVNNKAAFEQYSPEQQAWIVFSSRFEEISAQLSDLHEKTDKQIELSEEVLIKMNAVASQVAKLAGEENKQEPASLLLDIISYAYRRAFSVNFTGRFVDSAELPKVLNSVQECRSYIQKSLFRLQVESPADVSTVYSMLTNAELIESVLSKTKELIGNYITTWDAPEDAGYYFVFAEIARLLFLTDLAALAERCGRQLLPMPNTIMSGAVVEADKISGNISVASMQYSLRQYLIDASDPASAILEKALKHQNPVIGKLAKGLIARLETAYALSI